MIEVELKAHVADRAAVEMALASFAVFDGPVDKLDAYWHGPDWRLARGKKGFRVRAEGGRSVVTFKNKRSEGGIEVNREREFEISDAEAFAEFAQRLGCEPFYRKRKRGARYRVDPEADADLRPACDGMDRREATIELVEVEGLGDFIEIEVLLPDDDASAVTRARDEIRSLLERAGIPAEAVEPRYYSELLMEAGMVPRL